MTSLDISYTRVVSSDPREGVLAPPTTPYWGGGDWKHLSDEQ